MARLRDGGFVHRDNLSFSKISDSTIRLDGNVACLGDIVVSVEKKLEIVWRDRGEPLVQTVNYGYNASIQGWNSFLRWDNYHQYPGHQDPHHLHRMAWQTGLELPGSPERIGAQGWPTLAEAIREVGSWYYDNFEQLPRPFATAILTAPRHGGPHRS